MLRHVVLFRWQKSTTAGQVAEVAAGLAALPGTIGEIRSYRFGADVGLTDGSFDFAIVAEFDDPAAFQAYRDHPAHRAVADRIASLVAERAAVQFEVPG